jgi:hypothetical protein
MTAQERLFWYRDHKQEMIEDLQKLGPKAVIKKWNLTPQMISRLKTDPLYPGKRSTKPARETNRLPAERKEALPADGSRVFLTITDEDLVSLQPGDIDRAFTLYRDIYFIRLNKTTGGAKNV